MADTTPRLYEGMFLLNPAEMSGDIEGGIQHVREMLDRAEADVHALGRWDERKLAYPVMGQKRGVYLHTYFTVAPLQIVNIERDCNLSETVMRVMMLRAEHVGEVEMQAAKDGIAVVHGNDSQEQADTSEFDDDNDAEATDTSAETQPAATS